MPGAGSPPAFEDAAQSVRAALKAQYHAALAMLRHGIDLTPEDHWTGTEHRNEVWQIAYHTLFFAHLYLQRTDDEFRPWKGHVAEVQVPDTIPGPPDPESDLPLIPDPYTKQQVLEYWQLCDEMVDPAVDAMDVFAEESGFSWYPIPKLDHQLVNIRHIQHGAAQIADRVRAAIDQGVDWVGSGRRR